MQEEYDITIEKRRRSPMAGIAFGMIAIVILLGIPLYFFTYQTVESQQNELPLKAADYRLASAQSLPDQQDQLKDDTQILGQTVYAANGTVIGTLYDVYIDRINGQIEWISVEEFDDSAKGLRLLPFSDVGQLKNDDPVMVNMPVGDFLEIPLQTNLEDNLTDLISVRQLPGSTILDPDRGEVGNVLSVTYFNGKIEHVIFRADQNEFYVPFAYLNYDNFSGRHANEYDIILSERQAGAIQMYIQNSNQLVN